MAPRMYPLRPLIFLILIGLETERVFNFQGQRGITSVVQWNLHPVIFGVDSFRFTIGDKIITYRFFMFGGIFSVIITGNFTA